MAKPKSTPAPVHAPEVESGTAPDVDETTAKRQIAKHSLLDSAGTVVEDMKEATGIRYQDIASGETFDYQLKPNSDGMRFGALFGFRTLATNEASAVRQKGGSSAEQMEAIRDRFALIDSGEWVDRTREGGVRWDKATLASAVVDVMVSTGKITEAQKGDFYAKFLEGFENGNPAKKLTGPQLMANVRQVDGVEAAYKRLAGKTVKSVDDLAAMI